MYGYRVACAGVFDYPANGNFYHLAVICGRPVHPVFFIFWCAMVASISIRSNLREAARELSREQKRQLEFVTARTVNELAKLAIVEEKKELAKVFDKPTPFTVNAIAMKPAKKGYPVATVFIRPLAARYLAPYIFGGKQFLGLKPADLVPVGASANQFGNLPRNAIKKYMGRKDVFMGKIGDTYGVWQRPYRELKKKSKDGKKVKPDRLINKSGKFKLLVAFHEPVSTRKRFNFGARSQRMIEQEFQKVFDREMAAAMSSAR